MSRIGDAHLNHEPIDIAVAGSKPAIDEIVCELATRAGAGDQRALATEQFLNREGTYVTRPVTGNRQITDLACWIATRMIESHVGDSASSHIG